MMTGIDDQNPLRTQLENDLNSSEWLQKFKAINQLLHRLKAEIIEIQSCDLKWDTSCNGLVIHYPSKEIGQRLQAQQSKVTSIAQYASCISLVHPGSSDIMLKE